MDVAHLLHAVGQRLRRAPAVHFALLGTVIYLGSSWAGGEPSGRRVEVPAYRIEVARKEFERSIGRPATPSELWHVAAIVADQEVLFAYALDLELDKEPVVERRLAQIAQFVATNPLDSVEHGSNSGHSEPSESVRDLAIEARALGFAEQDLITRRVLIDSARRLIRAAALVRDPTDRMLADYLNTNPEPFSRPAEMRITQVSLASGVHGQALRSAADALLARLRSQNVPPEQASELGDETSLPNDLPLLPQREIERHFGKRFVDGLGNLPLGSWQGPIASSSGLHLVYVHERTAPKVPPLSDVHEQVRARVRQKLADDWLSLRLAQLKNEYQVVMPEES